MLLAEIPGENVANQAFYRLLGEGLITGNQTQWWFRVFAGTLGPCQQPVRALRFHMQNQAICIL
ncbi:hypothetical protein CKO11_13965 [Rhodobacter sp. TJ_12]|nr:hypothetical protein [Rhodobacter sp. TJ_12]